MFTFLISATRATAPACLVLLQLMTLNKNNSDRFLAHEEDWPTPLPRVGQEAI